MQRVLVVDDEEMVREVLSDMVKTAGEFHADTAVDGADGLEKVRSGGYDIIFTDLKMPRMNGLEFMEHLREIDPTIPVVVVTAHSHLDTALSAMREGASDFITKPFNFKDIRYVLDRVSREREILKTIPENGDKSRVVKTLNSALFKKLNEINSLLSLNMELDELTETEAVLENLPGMIERLLRARRVLVLMIREDRYLVADGERKDNKVVLPLEGSVFIDIDEKQGHLLLDVGDPDPITGSTLKTQMLIVPIMVGDVERLGYLVVADRVESYHFGEDEIRLLKMLLKKVSMRLENNALYEVTYNHLINTLKSLVLTIEARDEYTKNHSERVTNIALEIAKEMNCRQEEIDAIRFGGYLHDIGKIGVKDMILLKPARLTDSEFEEIKKHPVIGYNIISPLGFFPLEQQLIRHHHERFDGRGYPDGLSGEDIPLIARILAVADTYDSMTSTRPYRRGLGHDVAVEEIKRCAGSQFDPQVADAFFRTPTGKGVKRDAA